MESESSIDGKERVSLLNKAWVERSFTEGAAKCFYSILEGTCKVLKHGLQLGYPPGSWPSSLFCVLF